MTLIEKLNNAGFRTGLLENAIKQKKSLGYLSPISNDVAEHIRHFPESRENSC